MFFKLFSVFIAILVIQSIDGVCVTSTTTATTTTTTTVRVSGDTSALNNELLRASSRSNCDTVKAQFAIDNGANVNVVDETSLFPLFFASYYGCTDISRLLVNATGININAQTITGYTPLMMASSYGFIDIVTILINANANVNIRNGFDGSALSIATAERSFAQQDNNAEKTAIYDNIISLLRQAGATK